MFFLNPHSATLRENWRFLLHYQPPKRFNTSISSK
jgi:hypothetical protein